MVRVMLPHFYLLTPLKKSAFIYVEPKQTADSNKQLNQYRQLTQNKLELVDEGMPEKPGIRKPGNAVYLGARTRGSSRSNTTKKIAKNFF